MKNLLLISLLFVLMIFIGCATSPIGSSGSLHQLTIKVESVTDSKVEVINSDEVILTSDQREGMGLGRLSMLTWLNDKRDKAFTKLYGGLSVSDVSRIWNDLKWLKENTDIRYVELFINSGGGDAFSGLALADVILRARADGFYIEAHASGIVASAAVPIFASCSRRFAAKGTIFMVHEAALWKWPGRESASDIRSQNELMVQLQDRYISYLIKPTTKLNRVEWIEKEKKTTWFNAEKALEWGLVDEIE